VYWTLSVGMNYIRQKANAAGVSNKSDARVNVPSYTGGYDGTARGASGAATGVGGTNLGAGLNLGATFTDVPGGTANWTFSGGTRSDDRRVGKASSIKKAEAKGNDTGYTGVYDATEHTASGEGREGVGSKR